MWAQRACPPCPALADAQRAPPAPQRRPVAPQTFVSAWSGATPERTRPKGVGSASCGAGAATPQSTITQCNHAGAIFQAQQAPKHTASRSVTCSGGGPACRPAGQTTSRRAAGQAPRCEADQGRQRRTTMSTRAPSPNFFNSCTAGGHRMQACAASRHSRRSAALPLQLARRHYCCRPCAAPLVPQQRQQPLVHWLPCVRTLSAV